MDAQYARSYSVGAQSSKPSQAMLAGSQMPDGSYVLVMGATVRTLDSVLVLSGQGIFKNVV
jgi:hypothetical protein